MNLLKRTYELVDQSSLSQRQIAAGAGVERDWFAKFSKRRIPSPGVQKVQAVHDFLSNPEKVRAVHDFLSNAESETDHV